MSSRLDFFLIDDNLVNFPICSADVSHCYNSDHSYIALNIQGYWKLNNSFLYHDDFKTEIRNIIGDTCNSRDFRIQLNLKLKIIR